VIAAEPVADIPSYRSLLPGAFTDHMDNRKDMRGAP
jgi:hypothetical protein